MVKKWLVGLTVLALLVPFATLSFAQESAVKGNVGGLAVDSTGAVVPGANVTLTGATGNKTDKTDEAGNFMFSLLTPGFYSVKVEKQGFKTATVKSVEVLIGKTATIRVTLEPGAVSEVVEVTATAVVVDTTSTAVGANLPDTFYQSVPVPRNVSGLFYITPGAVDGGGTGRSNPSISGASGLENLYIADGVNITDKSFGGLGVFSRRYGSVGSGVNLSFIKEVSVKSGGFEPQYGQATGGVVQMVTKAGGNAYHGEIGGYFAPQNFEAQRVQPDELRVNHNGIYLNQGAYDVDGELGGYVPGMKDHLFFFASVDPTWNQQFVKAAYGSGLSTLLGGADMKLQANVYNYAGKLTWKLSDKHTIETSIFGDPTRTTTGANTLNLNIQNATGFSRANYGTRNWVVRYNGTISPSWLANFSFSWNNSKFTETPLFNVPGVTNREVASHVFALQGIGYYEDSKNDTYALNFDTQKVGHWLGQHTLSVGYRYERDNYTDLQTSSGLHPVVPATGAAGTAVFLQPCPVGDPANCPIGQTAFLWSGSMRKAAASCTLCPIDPLTGSPVYVSFGRGDYQPGLTPTFGRYHAAYVNDSWEINKHINISAGLRYEQWHMAGTATAYTFTDNWAPRVGVAIDPWGDHKTKVYANFGRYNYQTPLDAAIRSLSGELDVLGLRFAPVAGPGNVLLYNADGSINMALDAAHLLNNQAGGSGGNPAVGGSLGTGFAPGTKMMYQNEWVVGAEHQFHNGVVVSARFLYRNMPRALDDVSGVSPEGYNNGVMVQNYFIANPSPKLDLFPNANETIVPTGTCPGGSVEWPQTPAAATPDYFVQDANGGNINPATGTTWIPAANSICFIPNAAGQFGGEVGTLPSGISYPLKDGKPDGFPLVVHNYKAVEIEVNKAFANNWMLRANWRIARLSGNYEGAFRNDNGQTDPNISSLFDFTNGFIGMLGQQYAVGPLNTDRTHVVNVYASYVFSSTFLKNLELGAGVNFQSGTPINKLGDHPSYGNSGEVPLGGRGALGRMPVTGTVNVHLDRPFKVTEKSQLHLTADLFNITNNKVVTLYDQSYQINFAPDLNPDFLNPASMPNQPFQRPFYARFSFRWVF